MSGIVFLGCSSPMAHTKPSARLANVPARSSSAAAAPPSSLLLGAPDLRAQVIGRVLFFRTKNPSCMLVTMIAPLSKKG